MRKIIVIFGHPGAGKTYTGTILQEHFGFYLYDADDDLTSDIKKAIEKKLPFTNLMRDVFFSKVLQQITRMSKKHTQLAVCQTFIKERYRQQVKNAFPHAVFLYVYAQDMVRKRRLHKRATMPLNATYAEQMVKNFDKPDSYVIKINNTTKGKEELVQQLRAILQIKNQQVVSRFHALTAKGIF